MIYSKITQTLRKVFIKIKDGSLPLKMHYSIRQSHHHDRMAQMHRKAVHADDETPSPTVEWCGCRVSLGALYKRPSPH